MNDVEVRIYPYRWIVLIVFMLINVMVQILWICYAPVASTAAAAYSVPRESIDLLANLFMIIFLPVSLASSWAIDTFGFKKAVGFGAILIAAFGLLRAFFPSNYTMALIGTIGISIGQPFLLNAFTKLAALWFPQKQRATITGILFLSMFVGVGLGEALGPALVAAFGFGGMQLIYGIATAVSTVIFLVFARSNPPTPASPPGETVRALVLDGLKKILKTRDVYIFCALLLVGSAIVNGFFTLIDGVAREKGFSVGQGVLLTVIVLGGGVVGSIVLPLISDLLRRRKIVLIVGFLVAIPATAVLAVSANFIVAIVAAFITGLCITGLSPIVYQYGAEITHPAPEGTSNGVFSLVLQVSGFLILLINVVKNAFHGSYIPAFVGLSVLWVVCGVFLFIIKESPVMQNRAARTKE